MFYLYRHPVYDDEKSPIFLGEFSTYQAAIDAKDKKIDDDWFFESDFYVVDDS